MNEKFIEWMNSSLSARDWTRSDLARETGMSEASFSLVLSGSRNPGNEMLLAVAKAFRLQPNTVFIAAGIFPEPAGWDADQAEWNDIYLALSPNRRNEALDIARVLLKNRGQ